MPLINAPDAGQTYSLRTLSEVGHVAGAAAVGCRDAWRVEMGLTELLVNAIEHGNLAIGGALKRSLLDSGTWEAEIARRLVLPEFAGRSVRLRRALVAGRWHFEIEDDGDGFAPAPYLTHTDARRALPHGRGIALARELAFPDLEYLASGNRLRFSVAGA